MSRNNKLWDAAFDLTRRYIEHRARNSEERAIYMDYMSDRDWRNRDFNELIDAIVAAGKNIEDVYYRDGDSDEEVLKAGIADIVDGHYAAAALKDKDYARGLSNRVYDEMKESVERMDKLLSRSRGRDRDDRDDRRRDGRDDRYDDRDDRDDRGRGGSRERSYGERRDNRDNRDDRDNRGGYRNESKTRTGDDDAWRVLATLESGDDVVEETRDSRDDRDDRRERSEPVRHEPVHVPEVFDYEERSPIEGPDHRKADPYSDFWLQGEHWIVAHKSPWELCPEHGSSIPQLHDINTHIKYHVKDDSGFVREELTEMTEDNRYVNHELRNDRGEEQSERRRTATFDFAKSRAEAAGTEFNETEFKATENKTVRLVEMISQIDQSDLKLHDGRPVDSMAAAVFVARSKLAKTGHSVIGYSLKRTVVPCTSWAQLDLIDEVFNSNNLAAAQERLQTLKPDFDPAVWNALNQRYTETFLRTLRYQFQLKVVDSMNFALHYDKVLAKLGSTKGQEVAAGFASRTRFVNTIACGHLERGQVADMTDDLYDSAGDPIPTVVFVDFLAMASVDATLDQLGLGAVLNKETAGVSITSAGQNQLCTAIRVLYQNLDNALPAEAKVRVLLSTSDNRLVEILPFAGKMESFILVSAD